MRAPTGQKRAVTVPQVDAANRPSEIQLLSMDMPRQGVVLLAALQGIAADFRRLH
jgi:hypothetical protein